MNGVCLLFWAQKMVIFARQSFGPDFVAVRSTLVQMPRASTLVPPTPHGSVLVLPSVARTSAVEESTDDL